MYDESFLLIILVKQGQTVHRTEVIDKSDKHKYIENQTNRKTGRQRITLILNDIRKNQRKTLVSKYVIEGQKSSYRTSGRKKERYHPTSFEKISLLKDLDES